MLAVPKSQFTLFERLWRDKFFRGMRYGQAFFTYMKYDKTMDVELEALYYGDYSQSLAWINARLDNAH